MKKMSLVLCILGLLALVNGAYAQSAYEGMNYSPGADLHSVGSWYSTGNPHAIAAADVSDWRAMAGMAFET